MALSSLPVKFNFYSVYMNDLNKLNVFQFRKVIRALVEYSKNREIPENLSNKGMAIFLKIMPVIDEELKQIAIENARKEAGYKGLKTRWNSKNKQRNSKNIAKEKNNGTKKNVFN